MFRIIGRLSRSSISVLINGESGTVKNWSLMPCSPQSASQSAIYRSEYGGYPKDLIESELFGHEKGRLPAQIPFRQGRFEQADGGTLFLDEIGDMPLDVQTRLLRVLADGRFTALAAMRR
ncbi:sigma 54-interacting transcriptional regulator [Escherichia coli]|nr:sigma 54-interacting transcriptional regulator [Escherichia coli]